MEGEIMWNDLKALEILLTPSRYSEERSTSTTTTKSKNCFTPTSIGIECSKKQKDDENVHEIDPDFEIGDKYGRIQPEYEFVYKQLVSANDVYLQMSGKTPSSLSCDELALRVKLPQTESASDIQLDVKPNYVKLSSPIYFLALYLPHTVKTETSSAKWEMDTETLVITSTIQGEDFLND